MTTFFDWLMALVFGKRWVLHKMKQDYKTGIFIKEMDLDYQMSRSNEAMKRKQDLENEIKALEETPLKPASDILSDEEMANSKLVYDAEKKIKEERAEALKGLRNRAKVADQEVVMADGEVNRLNAENFKMRRKWDFVKKYKVGETYVDISK